MIGLTVVAVDEKTIAVSGIPPLLAQCLFELPEILRRRESPGIRDRLYQAARPDDPKARAEWHELADPDLRHLFASAEEIVTRDLTGLQEDHVRFPAAHLPAWLTALNQARLILGETHRVTEADMERTDLDPASTAKDYALLQLHVLGFLLQLLVEHAQSGS